MRDAAIIFNIFPIVPEHSQNYLYYLSYDAYSSSCIYQSVSIFFFKSNWYFNKNMIHGNDTKDTI